MLIVSCFFSCFCCLKKNFSGGGKLLTPVLSGCCGHWAGQTCGLCMYLVRLFVALCCQVNVIMPCSFFQGGDDEGCLYNDVPVGILCREQENITLHTLSLHHNASSVGIILEGNIVMDAASLPQAMYIVFRLTYALHLTYPKYMKNT